MLEHTRTKAFVLRRTNYGEADRILSLLTEDGFISAMAKSVRKEKSKLAGGIELFCLNEITFVEGKNNNLCTLTSARMLEHYDSITVNLDKLELASLVLKQVGKIAESVSGPSLFHLLHDTLRAINGSDNLRLIETWFWLNFAKTSGEDINFLIDTSGSPLAEDMTYVWDNRESALRPQRGGDIGVDAIKVLRFMLNSSLSDTLRITDIESITPSLLFVAKSISKV